MHQHQCVNTPTSDHCGGSDCFAKGRWSAQHAGIVMQHSGHCGLLVQTQSADERDIDLLPAETLIAQVTGNAVIPQKIQRSIKATARQRDVLRVVLGIADDTGLDRLSRSLADFAKMVDIFDRNGVSFSAVTQQINSATSMGRLMLNVLLSFAQFEREVTSERIRDKFAASAAKGMWMGGPLPLGYRVENRRLLIVPEEAELVRRIFRQYAADPYVTGITQQLMAEGITTRKGKLFCKQTIHKMFHNRIYLGEIVHKGKAFPGQHEGIITQAEWDAVHAVLATDRNIRRTKNQTRQSPPALLRGLVYAPTGSRMVPSYTVKTKSGGKRYRYYADLKYVRYGTSAETYGSINADQLEGIVVQQVLQALQSPASIQAVWDAVKAASNELDEPHVVIAMRNLGSVWASLFPEEQRRIVNLMIRRVQITEDAIEIQWHTPGWQSLVGEFQPNTIGAELAELAESA